MEELLIREVLSEKWIKPNCISDGGDMFWYNKYGDLHSVGDKPSIISLLGGKWWHKNGQLHRTGNKPAIIYSKGSKSWYKNGEYIKSNY